MYVAVQVHVQSDSSSVSFLPVIFLYVPRASKLNHPITAFLGILSWVPSVTLSFNIDRRLFQKSTVTCFQSFGKLCSSADGDVKNSKSDAHIDMLRNHLLLLAVASSSTTNI